MNTQRRIAHYAENRDFGGDSEGAVGICICTIKIDHTVVLNDDYELAAFASEAVI